MSFRITAIIPCLAILLGLGATSCGLDGIKGQVVGIHGNQFVLREPNGQELRLHVDSHSHRDPVQEGDDVQVYVNKDGYAEFIQRLDP